MYRGAAKHSGEVGGSLRLRWPAASAALASLWVVMVSVNWARTRAKPRSMARRHALFQARLANLPDVMSVTRPGHPRAVRRRNIPFADIEGHAIGDAGSAADYVRSQEYRVRGSDVDLLGDLDGVVDLDAEVAHGAFDLRMSKQ